MKDWRRLHGEVLSRTATRPTSFNVYGYAVAQTMVQVLKQCGDDLTRENVMKQAANLKNFDVADAAARHQDQHQPDRLLSDRAGAAAALQRRELGIVRRGDERRGRREPAQSSRPARAAEEPGSIQAPWMPLSLAVGTPKACARPAIDTRPSRLRLSSARAEQTNTGGARRALGRGRMTSRPRSESASRACRRGGACREPVVAGCRGAGEDRPAREAVRHQLPAADDHGGQEASRGAGSETRGRGQDGVAAAQRRLAHERGADLGQPRLRLGRRRPAA